MKSHAMGMKFGALVLEETEPGKYTLHNAPNGMRYQNRDLSEDTIVIRTLKTGGPRSFQFPALSQKSIQAQLQTWHQNPALANLEPVLKSTAEMFKHPEGFLQNVVEDFLDGLAKKFSQESKGRTDAMGTANTEWHQDFDLSPFQQP